jgi:hypothetical protein
MFSPYERVRAADGFGGLWDSIKDVAGAVIPQHTIVGKLINGDVAGAAAGTKNLVAGATKPKSSPTLPGTQPPTGTIFGFSPMTLAAIGGLAVVAFVVMKKRR